MRIHIARKELKDAEKQRDQDEENGVQGGFSDEIMAKEGTGSGLDIESLMSKVFRVYFRDKYIKYDDDLASHGISIEMDLYTHEINYESITIKEDEIPYLQILCNDPEE